MSVTATCALFLSPAIVSVSAEVSAKAIGRWRCYTSIVPIFLLSSVPGDNGILDAILDAIGSLRAHFGIRVHKHQQTTTRKDPPVDVDVNHCTIECPRARIMNTLLVLTFMCNLENKCPDSRSETVVQGQARSRNLGSVFFFACYVGLNSL